MLHATGDLPEDLQQPMPKLSGTRIAVYLIAAMAAFFALQKLWPDAPPWLFLLIPLSLHLILTIKQNLKKRTPSPSDPIVPGGLPRYNWQKSVPSILFGVAFVLLLNMDTITRHVKMKGSFTGLGVGILLVGFLAFELFDFYRTTRVEKLVNQCQYRKALEFLDGPLGWPSTGLWKLERSDALFLSGRLAEAEPLLREIVETERNKAGKALAFAHLARILMETGRYAEARRTLESAARLLPEHSAAPNGLAEVLLREGVEPGRALELTERALQMQQSSLVQRKGARERFGEIRGNQAWALALLGRITEAEDAIAAGMREADPANKPLLAAFFWRAGMAMAAVDRITAAVGHFRNAARLDPEGYYGGLAAKQLQEHSVWGRASV
jgi:tetratricopeptide (TPR) repeat protein